MIVTLNRCKHCGKEYEYYASGVVFALMDFIQTFRL